MLGLALAAAARAASFAAPRVSLAGARAVLPATAALPATVAGAAVRTIKTKSSVKKRFRVKPSGQITRMHNNKRHLNMTKSRKRVNQLGKIGVISTTAVRKKYAYILRSSPYLT